MKLNNKSFNALNISQFLGTLNTNIFKLLCTFYLINKAGESSASYVSSVIGIVFVVPFLLFSSVGGYLADKYQKATVLKKAKLFEVFCLAFGVMSFAFDSENLVYFSLFLLCTQSAIYSPSRYSIIPELVSDSSISKANGYIDACVYLAIVIGSTLAPFLSIIFKNNFVISTFVCLIISIVGYLYSRKIVNTKSGLTDVAISKLLPSSLIQKLFNISGNKYLILAIVGSAYFSLVGAFVQLNLIPYGMEILQLTKEQSAWLFFVGAIGIGLGSLLAGHYSGNHIELGIVPIGATLIASGCLFLGLEPNLYGALFASLIFGLGAGLFLIPLNSFIQWKAPDEQRGEIVASCSFLGWLGVLIASLLLYCFAGYLSPAKSFIFISLITTILCGITFYLLPDFFIRFLFILITRIIYRIRGFGLENVPNRGAAILVPNHIGYVDALILSATLQRRVRYIMWDKIYTANKILKMLFDFMGVIPISPGGSQESLNESFALTKQALSDGFMVCIFAEGKLTRDSSMSEFKKGFEKIAEGMNCPIIPVYLGGIWGSIFSHYTGPSIFTLPLRLPYPVSVWYGEKMQNSASSEQVKLEVCALAVKHYLELTESNKLRHENITFGIIDGDKIPLVAIEDFVKAKLNIIKPILAVLTNAEKRPILVFDKNQIALEHIKQALNSPEFPQCWHLGKIEVQGVENIPSKDGKYVDRKALFLQITVS